MREILGLFLIFTAILIGCLFLFGMDFDLKERVMFFLVFEAFIVLIMFGSYLIAG